MRKLSSTFALLAVLITFNTTAQNAGDSLFGSSQVHNIYISFPQTGYWDSLTAYYSQEKYLKCDITIDGNTLTNIGVKFKGNSSYNNPSDKKSFKIDFNEFVSGQKYDGLKKLNLNNGFKDPSFMREKIMLDFCQSKGIVAPRCTYANVYLNNQLWGLYTIVEEVNKQFLDQRFGDDKGNLFKGDPQGSLSWVGSTPSLYYTKYELHTNETQNDWSDLVHLIDKINNTAPASFKDSMESVLHTDGFVTAWAATNLFMNLDSYIGSGHNYFIYHDSLTNKFRWIMWDVNEAFGNFNMQMTVSQIENQSLFFVSNPATSRPLVMKMLADPYYKGFLVYVACEYLHNGFTTTELYAKIDSIANVIRPYVYADPKKTSTNQQFENNINMDLGNTPGLKPFIANRRTALINELLSYGCYVGTEEASPAPALEAYPNPFNENIVIRGINEQATIRICSVLGNEIASVKTSDSEVQLDLSKYDLPAGVYLLEVVTGSSRQAIRLVKGGE